MRLDLADVASVLLVLAVCAVALPKRDWRTIPARFRETRDGERLHLFGPPGRSVRLSNDILARMLQVLHGELRRIVELGVPLLLLAWYAERRSADARAEREALWRESKPGLVFRHLAREMSEDELHGRLRERGYLALASKLALPRPDRYVVPSMRLRLEWEQRLHELQAADDGRRVGDVMPQEAVAAVPRDTPATAAQANHTVAPVRDDGATVLAEIRTLGEIRIVVGGVDIAPQLMHHPALAFMVLYLLSWEVRRPGERPTREFVADETFGRQPAHARRKGVRQRLANVTRHFPGLRDLIITTGEYLGFDSTLADIDVLRVFRIADQVKAARGSLDADLLRQARDALDMTAREYLPGWDGVESKGTLGGSAAGELVTDVRDRVVIARLDILGGLADMALGKEEVDDAISYLEEALRLRPERIAIARRLADVYERHAQSQRAAQLRAEYGIDEAS
jgi:hypothetical protein